MNENEIATRAIERARAGKTLPLRAIFAAIGSGPTKLARGDDAEQGFQEALARDPNDHVSRLVYADWLDEHGEKEAAARLRWWGKVLPHMPTATDSMIKKSRYGGGLWLPEWARQLALQHYVRTLSGVDPAHPDHVHDELGAYGLVEPHPSDTLPSGDNNSAPWWSRMLREQGGAYIRNEHIHAAQRITKRLSLEPTKLARGDSITWVGGTLPNATRAIGVWSGGREASSVLTLPSKDVDAAAPEIARSAGQKSALWFTPGEGNDILHVLSVSAHPKEVAAGLNKHGVNEFTMIPKNGKTLVHVVDAGGVRAASVRAYATESGAKYASRPGTSRFVNLVNRLSRETDHDSFIHAIGTPIAGETQDGSTLGPYADWLEEHGLPYAAFIREAGKQALDGEDASYGHRLGAGGYGWFADTHGVMPNEDSAGNEYNARRRHPGNVVFCTYRSTSGHPVLSAAISAHGSMGVFGYPVSARVRAHVKSREHLRTLTADMPAVTREAIHAVFDPHLPK